MANTLHLLSAGSIRRGVTSVIEMFEDMYGTRVEADFTSAPKVRIRVLAGEQADVVIASAGALDALAKESKIISASRAVVGRTEMAVAMRKGVTVPDLSDREAFRRAMLEVDLLIYNEGSSGIHAAVIVDQLGLRDVPGLKIRVAQNGAEMFGLIAKMPGKVVGLANITNILDQIVAGAPVVLAALFPDEIQNVTSYEVAVAAGSQQAALAGTFVSMFVTAEGKKRLAAAGLN